MRVLVISAWEPWLAGHGGVWVLHHHLRELASRHEISVLSAGAPAAEEPPPADALPPNVAVRWFGTARPAGVDFAARRVRAVASGEPAHVFYVERPALLRAAREAVGAGVDLVYGFGWGTGRLHRLASDGSAGGSRPGAVHTAVDAWDLGRGGRRLPGWRRVADVGEPVEVRRHERTHYPQWNAVAVVAEPDAEHLRRLAPAARLEVLPNGVDLGDPPPPPPDRPVLGFHGNFDSAHNVEGARLLVEQVWPQVRRRHPEASVLLVGHRPPGSVRALAGDGVRVVGDAPALRPLLEEMSVEVVLMASGSGLKNKVLEALAAGRPVVANSLGAAGVGPGPGLLGAETPGEAARRIDRLLADPVELRLEGERGRARVAREFTWAASAARLEAVWESAVARARVPGET